MKDEILKVNNAKEKKGKRLFSFLLVVAIGFVGYWYFLKETRTQEWNISGKKVVIVSDGGLMFDFVSVSENTVGEFLQARNFLLKEGESVFPDTTTPLASGTQIIITRARTLVITIDGNDHIFRTQALTVGQALDESAFTLDTDDIISSPHETLVSENMNVSITRVDIREQVVEKPILFDKKTIEDKELSWRKTIVTQKGENGIQKLTYRVSTHDEKEVNRKLLTSETIKEPVTQVVTAGTLVTVGKSHTGGASWYAWTGTMAAANPWLPKGSYVRVTNLDNGKSVIVVINDRGPFVPGRIIDLDKVAFQKIASPSSGVITVKMEEITN